MAFTERKSTDKTTPGPALGSHVQVRLLGTPCHEPLGAGSAAGEVLELGVRGTDFLQADDIGLDTHGYVEVTFIGEARDVGR